MNVDRASPPSTPCVQICVIDPRSALCVGCGRTVREIAAWGSLDEPSRLAIMAGLHGAARRGALAQSPRAAIGGAEGEAEVRHILPIVLLVLAALGLYLTPPEGAIFGLDHAQFAQASLAGALVLWMLLAGPWRFRRANLARAVGGAAIWAALMVALTGVYAYRLNSPISPTASWRS